jgi:hypothetical protein
VKSIVSQIFTDWQNKVPPIVPPFAASAFKLEIEDFFNFNF